MASELRSGMAEMRLLVVLVLQEVREDDAHCRETVDASYVVVVVLQEDRHTAAKHYQDALAAALAGEDDVVVVVDMDVLRMAVDEDVRPAETQVEEGCIAAVRAGDEAGAEVVGSDDADVHEVVVDQLVDNQEDLEDPNAAAVAYPRTDLGEVEEEDAQQRTEHDEVASCVEVVADVEDDGKQDVSDNLVVVVVDKFRVVAVVEHLDLSKARAWAFERSECEDVLYAADVVDHQPASPDVVEEHSKWADMHLPTLSSSASSS